MLENTKTIKPDCLTLYLQRTRPKLRYEIIKLFTISEFKKYPQCPMVDAGVMELKAIFNFLDLMLYDNKVLDHSSTKLYSSLETPTIDHLRETYKIGQFEYDVIVKVEGHEIQMNSTILTENSPVFHAMLNSTFKEGQDKNIQLPGKKIKNVLEFFSFFTKPKAIDGKLSFVYIL